MRGIALIRKKAGAELIASSRLLVLQSKRLVLYRAQRQFRKSRSQADDGFLDRLRAEVQAAEDAYRASRQACGGVVRSERIRRGFDGMAEAGHDMVDRLRDAASNRPPAQRFELATDVQTFEELADQWRELLEGK